MKNFIYKVTNTKNDKIYIGATTKSIEDRKKDHLKKSKKGKSYAFQNAIATYGTDAFKWEKVDFATTINELAQKEKEYILKYNSKEQGYNSDSGAGFKKTIYQYAVKDGQLINSYDCLENAGSAVGADKRSISSAALGVNKTCNGFVWSYSSTFPTDFKDNRKKVVQQFSLEGEFINEFKSVSEASELTGCNKTGIGKVSRGERKSCGGFYWVYL
jgi:group I intron endonuclease